MTVALLPLPARGDPSPDLIAALRTVAGACDSMADRLSDRQDGRSDPVAIGNRLLKFVRGLSAITGADLFGDPALLMLLDLFTAGYSGRQVSVSSLCIASGSPATTALRWIRRLESEGLVVRHSHPNDRRSTHLALSARAETILGSMLALF